MPVDRTSHLVADIPEENPTRRPSFLRRFLLFLSSNLGLVIIVIAYSIGGAFLFILLEQYIELQNCQQGSLSENISVTNISQDIYNYVAKPNQKDTTSMMHDKVADYLKNFTTDIYNRRSEYRYSGQNCSESSGWSFPSALLFAITVITTIGYGHITPTSWEGQITCICYALIGIPIFLLCIANISSVLGDIFRYLYSGLLHCFCCVCRLYARNRRRRMRQIRAQKVKNAFEDDCVGTATLDPTWPEAHERYRGRSVRTELNVKTEAEIAEEYDDDDDDQDDIWDRIESRVPFGAVTLIFFGYISLGAFMFSRFEDWPMIDSLYFSYITLATVGFGDFVPGITSGSTSGLRFVLASLYILFGLAILAMCFDLLKEGIVDKGRWLGHKIGIIAEDEDQVDDDQTRYANFEYDNTNAASTKTEAPGKRITSPLKPRTSLEDPPAYNDELNQNSNEMHQMQNQITSDRNKQIGLQSVVKSKKNST